MRRFLTLPALVFLSCLASPALAQLPLPLGETQPKKQKKEPEQTKDEERAEPKTYVRPEAKPLPEGDPRVLSGPIGVIQFDGMVNPGMGEFVVDAIERAQQEKAQALIIEIDTPGGLVSTTEKMVQAILPSKVPIIVYITPSGAHAASAGTFITLAGHVAAMSPATRIGAAHPVFGNGQDPESAGKHMARKIENDLVALVEGIAKERNRNVEWAKDAVVESISATADEALEIGIIDYVARDRADLLEKLDGRQLMVADEKVELDTDGAAVIEYEPSLRSSLLVFLANPTIAMILGLIGFLGIIIEIKAPGMYIPGIVGILCLLIAAISMESLPIDVGGLILIVVGLGLLVAEFYTPTYGALSITGGISLAIGFVLLIDPSDPDFAIDPTFRLTWIDVLPVVLTAVGFSFFLSYFIVRSKMTKPFSGSEGLVGTHGKVLRPVGREGGQVFVGGEYWQAWSEEPIDKDEEIEVVKVDGLRLEVKKKS